MVNRFVNWLRRLDQMGTMATRNDSETLASEIDKPRERVRQLTPGTEPIELRNRRSPSHQQSSASARPVRLSVIQFHACAASASGAGRPPYSCGRSI